ncbi:MAG: type II toxin-antitoxin system VapC family toxin [Pseudohongiellaceae bacterium]
MILMDTCAIVWDALEQSRITAKALKVVNRADEHDALIISDISLWEISMLIKKDRIEVAASAAGFINLFLQSRNVSVISISPEIAELSTNFGNDVSDDHADRIIAATSVINNAQLVTADKKLRESELLDTVW